jgi:hypothetical protein
MSRIVAASVPNSTGRKCPMRLRIAGATLVAVCTLVLTGTGQEPSNAFDLALSRAFLQNLRTGRTLLPIRSRPCAGNAHIARNGFESAGEGPACIGASGYACRGRHEKAYLVLFARGLGLTDAAPFISRAKSSARATEFVMPGSRAKSSSSPTPRSLARRRVGILNSWVGGA